MTTIFCGDQEQILISHWMNKGFTDILVWGEFASESEQPYDEWLASKTEEEKQEMINQGFHPNVAAVAFGGTFKLGI